MSTLETIANQEYKYGFVSPIQSEVIPKGLSEDTVRLISRRKTNPSLCLSFG